MNNLKIGNQKKLLLVLLVVAALSTLPVIVLFKRGYFISDDGEWMIIRFSAFYQTLRDGQFPPRFFGRLNHGYGYPIGTFLYPGLLYAATPFKLIGFSFVEAIKIVIISSFISSGIGSFFWLKQRFSDVSAVFGSLIFTYFPYHLYDLYVRGSVGELLSFGVLPWLLYTMERKWTVAASFLYGFLVISHNTFALIVTPFLLFYTYLCAKRSLFLLYPFGLLLSAFFWLPSLVELPLTVFSSVTVSDWRNYFVSQQTYFLIGLLGVGLMIVGFYGLYRKKHTITLFFIAVYLLSLFFSLPVSILFWEIGILDKVVQFPWRFLLLSVWSGSFLTAFLLDTLTASKRFAAAFAVLCLLVISSLPIVALYQPIQRDEGYYSTNEDTTTTRGEYMPRLVMKPPTSHAVLPVVVTKGQAKVKDIQKDSYKLSFTVDAASPAVISVQTIYYPGWMVRINQKAVAAAYDSNGYITVTIPQGTSRIQTFFTETPLRLAADVLSLSTCILLGSFFLLARMLPKSRIAEWYNTNI